MRDTQTIRMWPCWLLGAGLWWDKQTMIMWPHCFLFLSFRRDTQTISMWTNWVVFFRQWLRLPRLTMWRVGCFLWVFFQKGHKHTQWVCDLVDFCWGETNRLCGRPCNHFFFYFLSLVGSPSLHGYDLHEKNLNKFPNFEGHGVLANLISQSK